MVSVVSPAGLTESVSILAACGLALRWYVRCGGVIVLRLGGMEVIVHGWRRHDD